MFDPEGFFKKQDGDEQSATSVYVGKIGAWLLHIVKFLFVVYGASHGISASLAYAGNHWWAQVAQSVGIIVTGLVLFGLYLMFMNGRIQGPAQTIAAAAVYIIGFLFECLAIITDSQMNSGLVLSGFLRGYLLWVLPIAPAVMGVGTVIVHSLEPEQSRARQRLEKERELAEERFKALIDQEIAKLNEARAVHNMQVTSRQAVIRQLGQVYMGPAVQDAIAQTAIANMPALLRAAGIEIESSAALGPGSPHIKTVEIDDMPVGDAPGQFVGGAAAASPDPSPQTRWQEITGAAKRMTGIGFVPDEEGNGISSRPMMRDSRGE